ncbi:MAG: PUA domain-containing protein [Candidatus Hadarchaeales archaeon]
MRKANEAELRKLRMMADYLFGSGAGDKLFPDGIFIVKSKGRIRQVWMNGEPICAIRASDGHIILNKRGAMGLLRAFPTPRLRVIVSDEAAPFVAQGKTVFAKHVIRADQEIRPGEEVIVVNEKDELLATGTAMLAGVEMGKVRCGLAVRVRRGYGRRNGEHDGDE